VGGTADDPGTLVTYYEYPEALRGADFEGLTPVTDPNLTNTFTAFEVTAHKRSSNNWQLMATYGSGWQHQPLGGDLRPFDPNAEIFAVDRFRQWYGKIGASYRFTRLDLLTSANLTAVNGDYFARTVNFRGGRTITSITLPVEESDSHHRPHIYLLDVRFQKDVLFGNHKVGLRADVFNILNNNAVRSSSTLSGRNFLRPTAIVPARIAVFGVTYAF
jgi:hypothetical protein